MDTITAGNQPVNLTAETIIKQIDLPWDWIVQKHALGFL